MLEQNGWPRLQTETVFRQHRYAVRIASQAISTSKAIQIYAKRIAMACKKAALHVGQFNGETDREGKFVDFQLLEDKFSGNCTILAQEILNQTDKPLQGIVSIMEEQLGYLKSESFLGQVAKMEVDVSISRKECKISLDLLTSFYLGLEPDAKSHSCQQTRLQLLVSRVEDSFRKYGTTVDQYNAEIQSFIECIQQPRISLIEKIEECRKQMMSDISVRLEVLSRMQASSSRLPITT